MKSRLKPALDVRDIFEPMQNKADDPGEYAYSLVEIWTDGDGHLIGEVFQERVDQDDPGEDPVIFRWDFITNQML